MTRRKKYPKLPNGFGCIKHLSGNRRNPYAVYPPSQGLTLNGAPIMPPAICYTDSWYKGFAVLTAYHAGTYHPGMEEEIGIGQDMKEINSMDQLIKIMLSNYSRMTQKISGSCSHDLTFEEVYEAFWDWKYVQNKKRQYSYQSKKCTRAAFLNCAPIKDRVFKDLKVNDLQRIIDELPLKNGSKELIVGLFHQMYKYAMMQEITDKDPSRYVIIKTPDDDESGTPFTEEDLKVLWAAKEDPVVELALIMCYSGHRISECKVITVDLDNEAFYGGLKSRAGHSKVVPIHPAILDMVKSRMARYGTLLPQTTNTYRKKFYAALDRLGIVSTPKHTPHDCRHTFSWLCQHYNISTEDRKWLLGHSFGNDVTNAVYGHRTLEELREEISKIQVPQL